MHQSPKAAAQNPNLQALSPPNPTGPTFDEINPALLGIYHNSHSLGS